MPAKTNKPLHMQLLEGFDCKSRADGSVHTIKANGRTVAECCVGAKTIRLNVRADVKPPKGLTLSGKSKSWPTGGLVVTEDNLASARALLTSAVEKAPAPKTADAAKGSQRPAATATRKRSTKRSAATAA